MRRFLDGPCATYWLRTVIRFPGGLAGIDVKAGTPFSNEQTKQPNVGLRLPLFVLPLALGTAAAASGHSSSPGTLRLVAAVLPLNKTYVVQSMSNPNAFDVSVLTYNATADINVLQSCLSVNITALFDVPAPSVYTVLFQLSLPGFYDPPAR
ncbi:MAG: hypothetical protein M1832_005478 [Thelocarpon impressellum]|nr:MAG: hypothetical protein M1832_005478 [Thelocarpon impressellum]